MCYSSVYELGEEDHCDFSFGVHQHYLLSHRNANLQYLQIGTSLCRGEIMGWN